MSQPHITNEYLESLSLENACILGRMLGAQYSELSGKGLSIADSVALNIEFATRNSQCERLLRVY